LRECTEDREVPKDYLVWTYTLQEKMPEVVENEVLIGGIEKREIIIADYDPLWPNKFLEHKKRIEEALKGNFIFIEHVGSTSVPQLAAKPIIDIIIVVKDSSNEATYLPALLDAGYVLRVREPEWHEHRMVRTQERDVHAHIFSFGCLEIKRQVAFRNRLRQIDGERHLYESVKLQLAKQDWADMNAYARAKTEIVEQITARALSEPDSDA
jgi:GrpB-like predicted nucleotidyltransferase (UPF0157 family)